MRPHELPVGQRRSRAWFAAAVTVETAWLVVLAWLAWRG